MRAFRIGGCAGLAPRAAGGVAGAANAGITAAETPGVHGWAEDKAGRGEVPSPNFFIIGAPKCGTTSLAAWLDLHPEACMSRPKEPHFFSAGAAPWMQTLEDYERCFAHAEPGHVAIGEASSTTVYYPDQIGKILEYQPQARFILCIRNPVDMAVSLHNYAYFEGRHDIADFLEAWHSDTTLTPDYIGRPVRLREYYSETCSLGRRLEQIRPIVPRDRLLVVLLQDLATDAAGTLKEVTDFLGISASDRPFPRQNVAKGYRSRLVRDVASGLFRLRRRLGISRSFGAGAWLRRKNAIEGAGAATVTPQVRAVLAEHFADDVARLGALVGRDLQHWLAPAGELT